MWRPPRSIRYWDMPQAYHRAAETAGGEGGRTARGGQILRKSGFSIGESRVIFPLEMPLSHCSNPLILVDSECYTIFRAGVYYLRALGLSLLLMLGGGVWAETAPSAQDAIVQNYCAATRDQEQSIQNATMDVEIDASLPKLKKHGKLHALRRISALGRITYEHLFFEGDGTVKNQVIARYLTAEVEAQKSQAPALAVTPANYKFKYRAEENLSDRQAYVFQVIPKKKRVGLFRGDIWIDAATFLKVQESGSFVKSPSIFLKSVEFTRKYEIRDGISVPLQVQSTVETRLVGKAQLTIDFSNFAVDAPAHAGLATGDGQ